VTNNGNAANRSDIAIGFITSPGFPPARVSRGS